MNKQWFVFYTKSRQEKKVDELLKRRGFESFLPLQKVLRQWSDRKKKVEVPLFNSYIFILLEEHAVVDALQVPGIAWNIKHNGKPAVLHQKELETIKRFIETGLLLETGTATEQFTSGDQVKVMDGPLKGATGVLTLGHKKHQFSMLIDSIGQVITVQIDPKILKKIA